MSISPPFTGIDYLLMHFCNELRLHSGCKDGYFSKQVRNVRFDGLIIVLHAKHKEMVGETERVSCLCLIV